VGLDDDIRALRYFGIVNAQIDTNLKNNIFFNSPPPRTLYPIPKTFALVITSGYNQWL
jgi:hypothetical protein